MRYKQFAQDYILRLEPQELIHEQLCAFATEHNIHGAWLQGLGAVSKVELAHYPLAEKRYNTKVFEEEFEVSNLTGNIALVSGIPFAHIHITLGRADYSALAGHLVSGTVGASLELRVQPLCETLTRSSINDPQTNLRLLELDYCQIKS